MSDHTLSRGINIALAASTALVGAATLSSEALAGSFAIREQSAYSQGASFAGSATCGSSIQAMFWNPAAVTCNDAKAIAENSLSFIFLNTDVDATGGTQTATKADPGDIGEIGIVPSGSFSYAFNDRIYLGVTNNGPFGLALETPTLHNGDTYFLKGEIFSLNVTPTVGYKVNDFLSVGAGLQIQHFDLMEFSRRAALGANNAVITRLSGDDIAIGFTLGATLTPGPNTEIGIGFRSTIAHTLEGAFDTNTGTNIPIRADLDTPEVVTLSLRQRINDTFTLLGTVEWTNWSRLQDVLVINQLTGAQLALATGPVSFPFNYDDGWFFALGGEYRYNDQWTFRGGVAWELSPIADDSRSLSLPDDDRLWLSLGATYMKDEKWTFNAAYTFITSFDTTIDLSPGNPWFNPAQGTFQADVDANVHILTVGLKRTFGGGPIYAVTK